MEAIHIIKRPLVTEKSTFASNEQNRYAFLVDTRADKTQIKRAIEDLYKVRVVGVSTTTRKSRDRRLKYGLVEGKISKKAVVRVHPEDRIELF